MNALSGEGPKQPKEPEIVLVSLENANYYLLKGDDHLSQMLLADGKFPTPILCMNFNSLFDAKRALGDRFKPGACWAVNPKIVKRLRDTNCLIETDA